MNAVAVAGTGAPLVQSSSLQRRETLSLSWLSPELPVPVNGVYLACDGPVRRSHMSIPRFVHHWIHYNPW